MKPDYSKNCTESSIGWGALCASLVWIGMNVLYTENCHLLQTAAAEKRKASR